MCLLGSIKNNSIEFKSLLLDISMDKKYAVIEFKGSLEVAVVYAKWLTPRKKEVFLATVQGEWNLYESTQKTRNA